MKRFLFLTLLLPMISFAVVANLDDVISALKEGNAAKMAKYFDNTVEVTMPDKSNSYSKGQAEMIIKDFFATNGVKSYTVIHKGENGGSQYCIGSLVTKNGTFRVTVYMKQKGDKQVLQEISFENT
ncbi:MAG: DUF4783 domain-containing protein [Chitinophagaceae bacterium]|nr:DUF4783 domain-containing protein [Chitinophagaceae bacterium]